MKIRTTLILIFLLLQKLSAQQGSTLSLEDAYRLARENYPLSKQHDLILKSSDYTLDNVGKAYFPQISILGQASYQSDVTRVPIKVPGQTIPEISKDQYRIYADISQILYDGGVARLQKKNIENSYALEGDKLETELYKLKERINQIFFGVLLLDAQLNQIQILKKDIDSALSKAAVMLKNGVLLKSQLDVMKAEKLRADQKEIELRSARKSFITMLALFTRLPLDEQTQLLKPAAPATESTVKRSELLVFDKQKKLYDIQYEMINARNRPRFSVFLQSGYGRPALNMLDNGFQFYYVAGVRLSWSLSGLYTASRDKAIIGLNRQATELQRETFLFNTELTLKQLNTEQTRLRELIQLDAEIIRLRESIKATALVQLENGIIRSDDYLRELNAEDQAKQNMLLHETQLLLSHYSQLSTLGQ